MNQLIDPPHQAETIKPALKHSGLGLASLIVSVLAGGGLFFVIAVAGFIQLQAKGEMDEKSPVTFLIGLFVIGGLLLDLVAVGLGVAGLLQKDRKKTLSILGLVFSGVAVLGTLGLMIVGLTAK